MKEKKTNRILELIVLFIVVPLLLALPIANLMKVSTVLVAIVYVILISKSEFSFDWSFLKVEWPSSYLKRVGFISALLFIGGGLFVYFTDPSLLFTVVKTKPMLWVTILFVYTFLSVVPQELVYRKFFYTRYEAYFENKTLFFFVNVFCFSFCHLFLMSPLVLVLTAIGGALFAYTYQTDKSISLVSLEHSIYGNIIFTLGMGEMLAFPV